MSRRPVSFRRRSPLSRVLAWAVLAGALGPGSGAVWAQEDPARLDACKTALMACVNACESLEKDEAARNGCQARCAADRALCQGEQSLGELSRQVDRFKGFLEGFTTPPGGDRAAERCATGRARCEGRCAGTFPEGSDERAGCEGRCTAENALCEARAGLDAATPQAREGVEDLGRALKGFLDRKGGFAPPSDDLYDFAPDEPGTPTPLVPPSDPEPSPVPKGSGKELAI
ncbi:hypothetical protein [Pararhodospirillum oryzae]|uniref:Uncharacterized protein n=1 Tax=Pararhodospirillum oryzae TaxID=478448 RepID=A0A512H5P1_9PROT|nr:hypothetical protein [Pararhodospirillum oryzae]GEO80767.1 hypothetical protein ROR02_08980 [Pararhodospirillum oryzae]